VVEIKQKFGFCKKFEIKRNNSILKAKSSFSTLSLTITKDNDEIASIKNKIWTLGDTYEMEIFDTENLELYLFIYGYYSADYS